MTEEQIEELKEALRLIDNVQYQIERLEGMSEKWDDINAAWCELSNVITKYQNR